MPFTLLYGFLRFSLCCGFLLVALPRLHRVFQSFISGFIWLQRSCRVLRASSGLAGASNTEFSSTSLCVLQSCYRILQVCPKVCLMLSRSYIKFGGLGFKGLGFRVSPEMVL